MPEARRELIELLEDDKLQDSIIIVLANKQDVQDSMSAQEVAEILGLGDVLGSERRWFVQPTSAMCGEGVHEAMDWVLANLGEGGGGEGGTGKRGVGLLVDKARHFPEQHLKVAEVWRARQLEEEEQEHAHHAPSAVGSRQGAAPAGVNGDPSEAVPRGLEKESDGGGLIAAAESIHLRLPSAADAQQREPRQESSESQELPARGESESQERTGKSESEERRGKSESQERPRSTESQAFADMPPSPSSSSIHPASSASSVHCVLRPGEEDGDMEVETEEEEEDTPILRAREPPSHRPGLADSAENQTQTATTAGGVGAAEGGQGGGREAGGSGEWAERTDRPARAGSGGSASGKSFSSSACAAGESLSNSGMCSR